MSNERNNQLDSNSSPLSEQIGGSHYKSMKTQPIEFILANDLGFAEGNIVKYVCRYKQKGGVEDLNKVIHYARLLIENMKRRRKMPKFTFNDPLRERYFDMSISDNFSDAEVITLFEETVKALLVDLKKAYTEKDEANG